MKLSTRSRYAARLLLDLALHSEQAPVPVGDLSRRTGISVKYLEQLFQPLKKADLISSVRGPKGGHLLIRNPEKVTLGQVVRLMEGNSQLTDCCDKPAKCARSNSCRMRLAWMEASQAMYAKLDSISLADLMDDLKRAEAAAAPRPYRDPC
jgi:Rrf2 family protein